MLCSLANAVVHAILRLKNLASPRIDLPRNQKGDQLLGEVVEIHVAIDEIVLVAAVAVPNEVGVVLENRELPGNALFANFLIRVVLQVFEDALASAVVDAKLSRRNTLGRRILGVAAGVLIETRTVFEEHVQEMLGRDQLLEEEPNRLLDRERLATLGREDDSVLRLKTVDPFLHFTLASGRGERTRSPNFPISTARRPTYLLLHRWKAA